MPRIHESGTSYDSLRCKDRRAQLFWSYLTDEVLFLTRSEDKPRWGQPPWRIDFEAEARPLPEEVDVAIIGGGFTGLAVAAWLRRLAPEKTVAVLEAQRLGAGASGRSGGLALGDTAAGDLPGLGDVLGGFTDILRELEVDCDQRLPGVWEVGHSNASPDSPIEWRDSGALRIVAEVPGGTVDPGKLVSGLARAAHRHGAIITEHSPVREITSNDPVALAVPGRVLRARQVLLATNAQSLELSDLVGWAQPKFTLAVATRPLREDELEALGLRDRKAFYTVDLPYLWGCVLPDHKVVWGSGLVHLADWRALDSIDVSAGRPAELLASLERRVRGLHPVLRDVKFCHRWGGPILIAESWQPVFARHPRCPQALILGAYSGHGVALSVYLARWAAEALLGQRELPDWGKLQR